ncbi:hypothetical protein JW758_04165 [Candidatus Peregrinibacteria bacterium]|nr:hypothetical protein [Candidatus Peregrinibacteria bacterium]
MLGINKELSPKQPPHFTGSTKLGMPSGNPNDDGIEHIDEIDGTPVDDLLVEEVGVTDDGIEHIDEIDGTPVDDLLVEEPGSSNGAMETRKSVTRLGLGDNSSLRRLDTWDLPPAPESQGNTPPLPYPRTTLIGGLKVDNSIPASGMVSNTPSQGPIQERSIASIQRTAPILPPSTAKRTSSTPPPFNEALLRKRASQSDVPRQIVNDAGQEKNFDGLAAQMDRASSNAPAPDTSNLEDGPSVPSPLPGPLPSVSKIPVPKPSKTGSSSGILPKRPSNRVDPQIAGIFVESFNDDAKVRSTHAWAISYMVQELIGYFEEENDNQFEKIALEAPYGDELLPLIKRVIIEKGNIGEALFGAGRARTNNYDNTLAIIRAQTVAFYNEVAPKFDSNSPYTTEDIAEIKTQFALAGINTEGLSDERLGQFYKLHKVGHAQLTVDGIRGLFEDDEVRTLFDKSIGEKTLLVDRVRFIVQELTDANKKVTETEARLAEANEELEGLRRDLELVQTELVMEKSSTNGDLEDANQTIVFKEERIKELTGEIADLEKQLTTAQGETESAKKRELALNKQIDTLKVSIVTKDTELDTLKKEITSIKSERDASNAAIGNLTGKISALEEEKTTISGEKTAEIEALEASIAAMKEMYKSFKEQQEELESELSSKEDEITRLSQENARQKVELEQLKQANAKQKTEITRLGSECAGLKIENERLLSKERRLAEVEGENKDLLAGAMAKDEKIRQLQADASAKKEENARLLSIIDGLRVELSQRPSRPPEAQQASPEPQKNATRSKWLGRAFGAIKRFVDDLLTE